MLTTKNTADMLAMKKRMENLSHGDRLRLCAKLVDLGDEGSLAIAETLGGHVIDELRSVRVLAGRR